MTASAVSDMLLLFTSLFTVVFVNLFSFSCFYFLYKCSLYIPGWLELTAIIVPQPLTARMTGHASPCQAKSVL